MSSGGDSPFTLDPESPDWGNEDVMIEFIANSIPDFFFGLFAFVVAVLIVLKWGIKPVVSAIDAREARIASQIEQAEANNRRSAELQAELDRQLAGAEAKIAEMIRRAEAEGNEHKNRIVEAGRAEADRLRVRALRDIDTARHGAVVALREEVAVIATQVAEAVIRRNLDAQLQQELVQTAVTAYEEDVFGVQA
ncbi:MAG: ATP synthase F0 subunit B [Planctomycetota bacterium]|nr:MAG: ATP synthase F0 subunit B [Planctomycetota bacterium]